MVECVLKGRGDVTELIGGGSIGKRVVNSGQRRWRLSKLQRPIATFSGSRSTVLVVGVWSPASSESDGGLGSSIGGDSTAVRGGRRRW
ncbi:hypothetical protein OWV82_012187 [Melia azedarach]|uniref:Uncharacterized protein n=1 Tax=Melia azedarach TaxID=155640 RepID=A0ACC1Y0P2_MELAZ|nr:hypothetical protein OWV82_012187 [Melia azedarach]